MKRIGFTFLLLLSCLVAQAEHSYLLSSPLDGGQDYHYTANSHITLTNGFFAEPHDGHEVVLSIDAFGVFPPEGGITGGSLVNNTNGVVGSLGGVVDISLLGGVVYSIPIDLPKGLGGLTPQLSIYYNSQDRNGLLGWGWNLGGTSAITRVGSTPYHDGHCGAGNRFCLDGKRLLKVSSGNYGADGVSYRTEQDQMSKIVSYTEAGIMGPSYFKVWSANGNILYYGNTNDSKALIDNSDHVNLWLLNKVEDRDGNIMEFHYSKGADTYQLDEIVYSGNTADNIDPSFRVAFSYKDRDDVDITYVGNCLYRKKQLLNKIAVFNGDAEMYSYSLTYLGPKADEGYYYNRLSKIRLNAGEEHLNPTIIQWSENNYTAISGSNLKYNVTTNGISNAFNNAVKFSGDFNGDGFADILALRPNGNGHYTQADVFFNKGVSANLTFDYFMSLNLSSDISWIQVADINGDGYDDIMFSNRIRGYFPFPDHVETEFYLCKPTASGGFEFVRKYVPICSVPSDVVETHLIGDFFGEGMNSIIVQAASENISGPESSLMYRYDNASGEFQQIQIPEHLFAARFYPADFNGDGITEILYKKGNGNTAIVRLVQNGNTYQYQEVYNGTPNDWDDCFPGDYNGDGLIDILLYNGNASQKWMIHLANQSGISSTSFPLPQTFPYTSPGDYQFSLDRPHHTSQYIKVADFDGNGCSDLALYKDTKLHVFYGPVRADGTVAPFANTQQISIQAFGLYDNMGVCIDNFLGQERLSFLGPNTLSRLPSHATRLEVKKTIDGMGRMTEFVYDYLSPNPNNPSDDDFYHVYSLYANRSYHVHNKALPLRALKKLTTYNVNQKPVTTQCFYEGALIHNQGKGFLGFTKTRQDDYCNGQLQKRSVRQYEIDYSYDVIHLDLSEENVYDRDGSLMARSDYSIRIYGHTKNDKVYIPISNKSVEEYDVTHPERLLKKEIYETLVEGHCPQTNKYDEVLSVVSQAKGTTSQQNHYLVSHCEYQELYFTNYLDDNLAQWLINRPATTNSIARRTGNYPDICHQKTFSYYSDKPHRVKSILDIPNDGSHPEDPLVLKTEFEYDATGNVTSQTLGTPNVPLTPRVEQFEYSKTYGRRLLTRRTDALGQESHYTYDPIYSYCASVTDYNGLVTENEQDPWGITAYTHHPDGTVTCKAIRWSGNGYYQWEKRTGQETKETVHATTGDLIRNQSYDINGELLASKIEYDDFGRVVKKSDPSRIGETNTFVKYEYDAHNQIRRIVHSDGSFEEIEHDGNEATTTYLAPDGNSQSSSKTFNVMGWVVKSTDAEGNSVIYDYRADGKPLWSQIEGHPETRIEMEYDALGNQSRLTDPDYGTIVYEHNAFGELTRQTSPKQDEVTFSHDALGRTVTRVETNQKTSEEEVTEWIYGTGQGQRGLLTQINTSNQVIRYFYDPLLRLTELSEQIQGVDYHTVYEYDQASRVSGITYPSGYHVNYHYTSEGDLKCITDNNSNNLWNTLEATPLSQPSKFVLGNGCVSEYGYDKSTNRLVSILTTNASDKIQNITYTYDIYSNIINRSDLVHGNSEQFTYDPLNRLTSTDNSEGHSEYRYDLLGRMTFKSCPQGAVFNNADYSGPKPHAIKVAEAQRGIFPQERMDIVFNVFDKVESISEGTSNVRFIYGYDHQRIRSEENINGTVRHKTYVNSCEFITKSDGSDVVRTFISGPMGVFAVVETAKGRTTMHYIHKDHLGSWVAITDSDGHVEQERHFDAWGNCENPDDLMFDRGFTGHEHIKSMGLINMNGRLYDPLTSSMLSPDNNIQMPDFTQNFNRYAYCLNNPLIYTDPDGNSFVDAALIFYLVYCTDFGYEFQKFNEAFAFHIDLHLSSQQIGIGFDISFGVPKKYGISYRSNLGATYYWRYFDNSYSGFEFRLGGEWCVKGCIGFSGTTFYQGQNKQTTNTIILGTYWCDFRYENDYMFNFGKYIPLVPAADNGDRYRSAAARFRLTALSIGVNIFTGDPGFDHDSRRTFEDPEAGGRETYTISANGDNPDEYRVGLLYVGLGPFKIGVNSEQIRSFFQNRFAHDFLCMKDSPYFKVLDRPRQTYFYFGTETGSTLW